MNYLKTVYNRKREPKTVYPSMLINYLIKRFGLKKGYRLLELGVGNGDFLTEFSKHGIKCFGVDREIFPKIDTNIKIKKVNLSKQKLPFPSNSFDVVYHKSVIEHFYRDEAEHIMKETYRVLKKNGKLIVLVPDWISQMENFFEDYTQVHPYDVLAIKDILKIFDFKKVESEKFYQLPLLWKYPMLKHVARFFALFMPVPLARKLTDITGWKFFRWFSELMILGYGEK